LHDLILKTIVFCPATSIMPEEDLSVRAQVQYLATANDGTATYYASEAGADLQQQEHTGQFSFCDLHIHNGRSNKNDWSVDREGFQLIEQSTSVDDFRDENQVTTVFYKEVKEALLKNIKGATRVEIFDHTRRASTAELRKKLHCREPSSIVHNDYTSKSATKRLFDMLPQEAENLSKKRFAIVNLWRSMAGTIESAPLAFCDSTSIHNIERDLISVQRVAKNRIGELQMALFSPDHQWYYFPNLTANEALIFKTFDSESSVNKFTLHTALDNVGDESVPRQSIEIRAFIFFD
jgi:hypothetical protein